MAVAQKRKGRFGSATQADVARAANVSSASVSRVLNGSSLVSPDVTQRVRKAMKDLAYIPHGIARSLALNRSGMIGAIIPTINNDIFAQAVNALMDRLREKNYTLLVSSSNYSLEAEYVLVQRMLENGVDGLFLVGADHDSDTVDFIHRSGRPFVFSYVAKRTKQGPTIGFDNEAASSTAIDHLVSLGHKNIGMFAGITDGNDRASARFSGAKHQLAKHHLVLDEASTCELPYTITAGREAFRKLAQEGKLPTAILCGNDILAMGILFEAAELGVNIPGELSVVGFDNHPLTKHFRPSLTTVDIRADNMAEIAADALIAAIELGSAIQSTTIESPLLIRETTAPPHIAERGR